MPTYDDAWFRRSVPGAPLGLLQDLLRDQQLRWGPPRARLWAAVVPGREMEDAVAACDRVLSADLSSDLTWVLHLLSLPAHTLLTPFLVPSLPRLLYAECVLYLEPDNPFYRDHFIHQARVALMGDDLLRAPCGPRGRMQLPEGCSAPWPGGTSPQLGEGRLLARIAARLATLAAVPDHRYEGLCGRLALAPEDIGPGVVLLAWWIAALCHDLGRAAEFAGFMAGRVLCAGREEIPLLEIPRGRPAPAGGEPIDSFLEEFLPRALHPPEKWRILACGKKGHPAAGALLLLDAARRADHHFELGVEMRLALALAAEAILRHDLDGTDKAWNPGGGKTLTPFADAPLAFLLQLCDRIDLFRPQAERPRIDGSRVTFEFRCPLSSIELTGDESGAWRVRFVLSKKRSLDPGGSFRRHLDDEVRPGLKGRFGPKGECPPRGLFDRLECEVR